MLAAVIAAIATVAAAIITYALTYYFNRRQSLWEKRLERTNAQLKQLYGPLLSLAESADRIWEVFSQRYGGGREGIIREEGGDVWISWITDVFQPPNNKMMDIIFEHADLLVEDEIPQPLLDFSAHVAGYGVLIKRWQKGDKTDMYSGMNWPPGLLDYLRQSFVNLKAEQRLLLDKTSRASSAQ